MVAGSMYGTDLSAELTFSDRVVSFNRQLAFTGKLPAGIRLMNPFRESPEAQELSSLFYRKYYSDNNLRMILLGINPGRHGAGLTGIPFTDTKRLTEKCGIMVKNLSSHETSSVFIYRMIDAFGGPEEFYNKYYINSVCPLGFVKSNEKGRELNYNYYDSRELTENIHNFILDSIKKQLGLGIGRDKAFCLGTGKNFRFLNQLNKDHGFFGRIIPLEHPRYIMQYKSRNIDKYIDSYIEALHI
ncbi:MAG TPA: uracil-DNA glycosylase family protein [Bacteroidales bacterium]|nr:uracil-DNA glycosylase family protein [Bacteroidales bacterium]